MGAGPRHRGSSEACTFTPPYRTASRSGGIFRPYAAHTSRSGAAPRAAGRSLWTGSPSSRATSATGRGEARPRLPGLSARVMTAAMSMTPRAARRASARSEYVAKSGVPRNTTRGADLADGGRRFLLIDVLGAAQEIQRGQPGDVEDAVDVIELLVERTSDEALRGRGEALAALIQRAHADLHRALDIGPVARYR